MIIKTPNGHLREAPITYDLAGWKFDEIRLDKKDVQVLLDISIDSPAQIQALLTRWITRFSETNT